MKLGIKVAGEAMGAGGRASDPGGGIWSREFRDGETKTFRQKDGRRVAKELSGLGRVGKQSREKMARIRKDKTEGARHLIKANRNEED